MNIWFFGVMASETLHKTFEAKVKCPIFQLYTDYTLCLKCILWVLEVNLQNIWFMIVIVIRSYSSVFYST